MSLSDGVDPIRKRVGKACDRCRLKKSKCDGTNPCNRCKQDNTICIFGERKKSQDKIYPKGYVEQLEQNQKQLVAGLRALYKRTTRNEGWIGPILAPSEAHGGHPLTHDILSALDVLKCGGPDAEGRRFEDDFEKMQDDLKKKNAREEELRAREEGLRQTASRSKSPEETAADQARRVSGPPYPSDTPESIVLDNFFPQSPPPGPTPSPTALPPPAITHAQFASTYISAMPGPMEVPGYQQAPVFPSQTVNPGVLQQPGYMAMSQPLPNGAYPATTTDAFPATTTDAFPATTTDGFHATTNGGYTNGGYTATTNDGYNATTNDGYAVTTNDGYAAPEPQYAYETDLVDFPLDYGRLYSGPIFPDAGQQQQHQAIVWGDENFIRS